MALISKDSLFSIYDPEIFSPQKTTDQVFYKEFENRHFSMARYALLESLRIMNLNPNDEILIPSFICQEVLLPIKKLGLKTVYYHIDKKLNPIELPSSNRIRAVLLINYFGFPQDLKIFKEYCEKHDCFLIEDNAHGFLSRSENGDYLGTRADVGVFSLRKTLPISNGAILVVKNKKLKKLLAEQRSYSAKAYVTKSTLRKKIKIFRPRGILFLTKLIRILRKIMYGSKSICDEGFLMEEPELFDFDFLISGLLEQKESERRIKLYKEVQLLLSKSGIEDVFLDLPLGVVPQGYPFICDKNNIRAVKDLLYEQGIECYPWPQLPPDVEIGCPEFYKQVYLVRFLW